MTDTVKSWIEERRAIHSEGTGVLLRNPYELNREYDLWGEDAEAIADAHNMFPRALDALQAVLEEHLRQGLYEPCDPTTCALDGGRDHIEVDFGEWVHADERVGWACFTCRSEDGEPSDWPCQTVQAIEWAIND